MNSELLAFVLHSRRWVDVCVNLLLELSPVSEVVLRRCFAVYYLEALLLKKEAPTATFKRLIELLSLRTGISERNVSYILEVDALRLIGSTVFRANGKPEQKKYAMVVGQHNFYRHNETASVEDVLREALMRKAWQIDWTNCPGYRIFTLRSDCEECHSIYEKVNYKILTEQELISTILPRSEPVIDQIFSVFERLLKKKPEQKIIFLAVTDPKRKLAERECTPVFFSKAKDETYAYCFNMTEKEALVELRKQLPAIPARSLDFETMFQKLARPLPAGTNAYYRTFNHTREGVRVAIELELGLVNRSYPDEYVAVDSISDYFSYEQRMECNKTRRTEKGRVPLPSPIVFWKRQVPTLFAIIEENAIQTEEDMAEYIYAKTSACGIFNAGFAAHIYRRFGGEGCRVLDAFAGWGERMVAAVAVGCSEYQGYDTNERIPYTAIQKRLRKTGSLAKLDVEIIPFELAEPKKNHFDVTVASPPFFDYELYLGGETSTTLYKRLDEWTEKFWKPSLRKMLDAMRSGGHIFLYIPTGKDDVARTMNEAIEEVYAEEAVYVGKIGYAQQLVNSPKKIRTAICYRKK